MSSEVSGQPAGLTLLRAIGAEIVSVPDAMIFPKWQHWRKHEGPRPTKKKDGITISTADEVKLWKQAMDVFHDIKSDDEEDDDEDEEEEHEKDGSLELVADVSVLPALPPPSGRQGSRLVVWRQRLRPLRLQKVRQTRPSKARALLAVGLPHQQVLQSLRQMN